MAGIPTTLFFNVTRSVFVSSVAQPIQIQPAPWYRGDVRNLQVTFCRDEPGNTASIITDLTAVQCGVGVLTNSTVNTPAATSATAGTPVNNVFPILLPLNLASIATLLASAVQVDVTLEFVLTGADSESRYQTIVQIRESLLDVAAVDPTPPEVALGKSEAQALYVPKQGAAGGAFTLKNTAGEEFLIYVGDDRQLHCDPV